MGDKMQWLTLKTVDKTVCYYIYKFKIYRIQKMNSFQTPIKSMSTQNMQNMVQREGDWVCYNCNNLNFSFRKRCNRCKYQTRQQNQNYAYYCSTDDGFLPLNLLEGPHAIEYTGFQDGSAHQQRDNASSAASGSHPSQLSRSSSFESEFTLEGPIDCGEMGWSLYLNGDSDSWESSCSDSSGENHQECQELDYQIEQMVTKIII